MKKEPIEKCARCGGPVLGFSVFVGGRYFCESCIFETMDKLRAEGRIQ